MARWPNDDPASLKAFYGDPDKGEPGKRLVPVTPPFRMTYDGKPIKAIQFHQRAAPALSAALAAIWEHYGRDQKKIDALGISKYAGSYNPRKIRGSATKWSNHAYGAAIDLNAEENGLYAKGNMPQPVIDAFKAQGALWGGDYTGRKDPMHFEFCSRGFKPATFVDAPMADGDSDSDAGQPDDPGVEDGEKPKTFWDKFKNWFLGGGIGSLGIGGSWLSGVDFKVVALLVGAGLIVFLVVWFTKKGNGW